MTFIPSISTAQTQHLDLDARDRRRRQMGYLVTRVQGVALVLRDLAWVAGPVRYAFSIQPTRNRIPFGPGRTERWRGVSEHEAGVEAAINAFLRRARRTRT